jgi:hypothetical protein
MRSVREYIIKRSHAWPLGFYTDSAGRVGNNARRGQKETRHCVEPSSVGIGGGELGSTGMS